MKLAVFLLAGRGSRLGPYGDHLPKCLLEVSGIPILHRMLGNLKKQGLKKAILVVGFLWEEIYKSVGTITYTTTKAITEHGLFNIVTAGILMDRHTFTAINVVNTDQIEFTYELTVNDGG